MVDDQPAKLSRQRAFILAIFIGGAYFVWGLMFSIQPPFYPKEAEAKGATPSQYGFVFGIVHLAAFISAPIFAHFGNIIRPKRLINFGGIAQGVAGICFGLLEYVQDTAVFLGLSYFFRFIDGMADAASWGAIISIMMKLYPDKVATIMSWTEMAFGLGYSLGPAVGGAFYDLGGFKLPFITVGSIAVVVAIALIFLIPDIRQDDSDGEDAKQESEVSLHIIDIVKSPAIFTPYLDNVVNFCGFGFIESMLEPHAREAAGLSAADVRNIFVILGAVYFVGMLLAGYCCDHFSYPVIISILGNVLMAAALLLVGPVPFLNMAPSKNLLFICGALIGFGYAQTMVSTFSRANNAAIRQGFASDMKTYLVVAGIWSATFYFGNFLGSTVSGVLVDRFGFPSTSTVFFILYLIFIVIDFVELGIFVVRDNKSKRAGYEALTH